MATGLTSQNPVELGWERRSSILYSSGSDFRSHLRGPLLSVLVSVQVLPSEEGCLPFASCDFLLLFFTSVSFCSTTSGSCSGWLALPSLFLLLPPERPDILEMLPTGLVSPRADIPPGTNRAVRTDRQFTLAGIWMKQLVRERKRTVSVIITTIDFVFSKFALENCSTVSRAPFPFSVWEICAFGQAKSREALAKNNFGSRQFLQNWRESFSHKGPVYTACTRDTTGAFWVKSFSVINILLARHHSTL